MLRKINSFLASFWFGPVCIFILWFVFSSPYFFQNLVPFPADYGVNHFPPWSHYEQNWGPISNGAMPDIIDQIYPWRHFSIEQWKNFQIPLWNPNNFSGNPHIANFQSAAFNPLNLLFFVTPFIDAWSIIILIQPLLAGIGIYLFLRTLKVSTVGASLSGITFMFCGFLTVWMAYGTLSLAISYLPIALFAIEKYLEEKKYRYLVALSLAICFSLFSGHFQTSLYLLGFVFLYVIFKYLTSVQKRYVGVSFGFVVLGILLSMPQILPSIEFYFFAPRSESYFSNVGIPFSNLITLFAPDFFGNPVTLNDWRGSYAEWASFVGIIPLSFVFLSALFIKKKTVVFFWIVMIVFLLLSLDSPLQNLIAALKIPVLSTSNPTRIIVLASFAIAVLAGFGVDAFSEAIKNKIHVGKLLPLGILGLVFVGIWSLVMIFSVLPPDKAHTASRNLILPSGLFGLLILSCGVLFIKRLIRFYPVILLAFLILAGFDSLRFVQKWMPFEKKEFVFPNVPVTEAMQTHIEHGRYFGNLGAQVATLYGVPSLEGYDPLYIKRYGEFVRASEDGSLREAERSVVKLSRTSQYTPKTLNVLSANIIFHPKPDSGASWAFPVWEDKEFKRIYQDEKFELYKRTSLSERARMYYSFDITEDDKKMLQEFYTDHFDARQTLMLEKDPGVAVGTGSGKVHFQRDDPNTIDLAVDTDTTGMLFLADNFYPGWSAYVDGKEVEIFRANYAFRAIVVPEGKHEVQFNYQPSSFILGSTMAIIGLVIILGGGVYVRKKT